VDPRLRVQSRRIGDELCGGPIVEALETCVIVAVDEVMDEGVALDVGMEFVFALVPGDAGFGPDGLRQAPVEALDEAIIRYVIFGA